VLGGPLQAELVRIETDAAIVPVKLEREGRGSCSVGCCSAAHAEPFTRLPPLFAALGCARLGVAVECYDNGLKHVYVALETADEVAR